MSRSQEMVRSKSEVIIANELSNAKELVQSVMEELRRGKENPQT